MKLMLKKAVCWTATIITLFAATLSPLVAFAATNVSDAKQAGQYGELAGIRAMIQAADACVKEANNTAAYVDLRTTTGRDTIKDYYSLKRFDYDNTTLYSNYLESIGSDSRNPDGKVYCSELGNFLTSKLLAQYSLDTSTALPDIICGKNNEGGLFTIRTASESSDCKGTFAKVQYYTEAHPEATSSDLGTVWFQLNPNFSFANFLSSYTGDLSSISSELLQAERYLGFKRSCVGSTYQNKSDYDAAVNAGADNLYQIYNNGKIEYYSLSSPNTKVYANGDVTNSASSTCAAVAQSLAPTSSDNAKLVDSDKLTQISSCYASAESNLNAIKKVQANVEQMYNYAVILAAQAENALNQLNSELDEANYSYLVGLYSNSAGNGSSLDAFKAATDTFQSSIKQYNAKWMTGSPSSEETTNMRDEVENYKNNLKTFKTNVKDKIDNAVKSIPIALRTDPSQDTTLIREEDGNGAIINQVSGFYSFDSAGNFTCSADSTLAGIASTINDATGGDIELTQYVPPSSNGSSSSSSSSSSATTEDVSDYCYNAGIEGMSWILCPAMNNMTHTATALEAAIRDMLSVDTNLYNNSSPTKVIWDSMRNIANVIIIVILLVIIFSQLTGYGIDNYGIKKMLPKLILMAVGLNLSFYICELAVDISNIAGEGLNNLFATLAQGADVGDANIVEGFIAHAIARIFAIAGVAGAGAAIAGEVVTAVAFAPTTVMAVIMIVLALLAVIVAILLFFLMLGARMIIVIFCIAISPIAFVCYILPNTQKIFKRWWTLFESALIIFPICGAVMGISYIIKAIVSTAGGTHIWMWIIAIFVPYLPFFMLPSLLKGAINGLGSVGAALTSMGGAFRKGIMSGRDAIRNTEAYKAAQEVTNRNRANWQAGFKFDRRTGRVEMRNGKPVEAETSRFRRFLSGGTVGTAKAREQVLKNEDTADSEGNITVNTNVYSAQRVKDQNKQTYKVEEAEEGVARVTSRYARQDARNRRITEEEKYDEGQEQVSREYARRTARNERLEKQAKIDALPAEANYDTLLQRATNQRLTDQAKMRRAPVMTEAYANQLADNEVEMEQGKIDVGAPNVSRAYAHRVASNAKINEQAKIDNLPAQMTREYANQTAANESIRQRAQINEGAVRTNYAYEKQMAENARLGQQAKIDVGAPVMQRGTLEAIANNERLMTNAQQQVGVAAINEQIARSRAEASRDSQEYKLALDQFSNLDKSARQAELWRATYGSGTGAGARTRAAFDSLFKTGDMDEILQVMQNIQPATLDPSVRESLVQSASASGNVLLKGWAKTNGMINLNNYITSPAGNNGGLRDYINNNAGAHALDNMDKDTLKIISEVPGSASALAPIVLRNAAVSSANQNAVSRQAIIKLINDPSSNKNAIGNEFSASDLTKISAEVARALGPTALAKAIAEAKKPGNESILASIPTPVKQELGIA